MRQIKYKDIPRLIEALDYLIYNPYNDNKGRGQGLYVDEKVIDRLIRKRLELINDYGLTIVGDAPWKR